MTMRVCSWTATALFLLASLCSTAAQSAEGAQVKAPMNIPNWQYAPIANPYHFVWWKAPAPSNKEFSRVFPLRHNTLNYAGEEADRGWWQGRGVWAFGWSYGTQPGCPYKTVEEFTKYLTDAVASGAPGICFDEWVNNDEANPLNKPLAEACRIVKESHPDFFIAAYTHMQSAALIEALQKGWVDLAIVESYPYVSGEPAWNPPLAMTRLGLAKRAGVEGKTIPAFWISPGDASFTEEWLEDWFKKWRAEFPEMPGIAPLFPGGHDTTDPRTQQLVRACERLIEKYYINPAPKPWIVAPADGAILDSPSLQVRATSDKPIAKWRLYVDSKLVASPDGNGTPDSTFGLVDLPPGPHVLTVHAITADWCRGARQIAVEVR